MLRMMMGFWGIALVLTTVAGEASGQQAAKKAKGEAAKGDAAKRVAFFENKIRPVLVQHCYKCHSAAAKKSESGLRLDTKTAIRRGGDRGPAVVPGKPSQSILLTAISHQDVDLQMPPKANRLAASVVRDFEDWIRSGADDPRDTAAGNAAVDLAAGRRLWSMRKPKLPAIPKPKAVGWAKRDLDRFVLARLDAAGLQPSQDATPHVLLRRLAFDLVGLPPTQSDDRRFSDQIKKSGIESALETEVDRLLASSRFGERWGRHWLDVARFAESSGKAANISFPYAWRYRDYVIDCFNRDLPYDRFLVEQIAGDLLPYENAKQRARLLIATGFLAVGPKNLDEANRRQFAADVVDEQIDTLSRAVMANSVACARCHDHKFDPFTMTDYYALAGIFASTKTFFGTFVSPANRVGGDPLPLPKAAEQAVFHRSIPLRRVRRLKAELAALKKEEKDGRAAVLRAVRSGKDARNIFTLRDALRIFWRSGAIEGQLEKVDENGKAMPLAMGVLDRETATDASLLEGGDVRRPGKRIRRGFPQVIELNTSAVPKKQSGRLQLAHWLTHREHPLTARVMANRVWHYLFGAGLVSSVDNFGMTGSRPSHPLLLDHLAVRFTKQGWSVKKLVREIVLSRTYRQASTFRKTAFDLDPNNRLLWRSSKRRLDAESIRDAMLAVSGDLDSKRPEASLVGRVIGDRPISLIGLDKRLPQDLDGSRHRSVYLPVIRDRLPDVLSLFDFAEPSLVSGARQTTNVPSQALYLMNSEFVRERANSLARRLENEKDRVDQIRLAFRLCFNRLPDSTEKASGLAFLSGKAVKQAETEDSHAVLLSYCQALLSTVEFRSLD